MEKKLETFIEGLGFGVISGLYWDNGKEKDLYNLGFRV